MNFFYFILKNLLLNGLRDGKKNTKTYALISRFKYVLKNLPV